jgi:single-strand DNA-binding protein
MASYNKVILAGNLTRDPEMRVTPTGQSICQFGLAINSKYKSKTGEDREEVTYVDCEAWGKTAELVAKYLTKGRPALVDGRLKMDQWEDKTTREKKSKMKVVVENVQFLGSKNDGPAPQQSAPPNPSQSAYDRPATGAASTEDVPF